MTAVYTDDPALVPGCRDCLELATEDLDEDNEHWANCLHCQQEITARNGVEWRRWSSVSTTRYVALGPSRCPGSRQPGTARTSGPVINLLKGALSLGSVGLISLHKRQQTRSSPSTAGFSEATTRGIW